MESSLYEYKYEYKVISRTYNNDLQKEMNAASTEGYHYLDSVSAVDGGPVIIMERLKPVNAD